MNTPTDVLLNDYDARHQLFEDFRNACAILIKELLGEKQIHTITSRVKGRKSLAKKLTREGKNYQHLTDVTDIIGIRIITLFENEISEIGNILAKEFAVDPVNSVDKREKIDPDRFGYLSLHYICSFLPARLDLTENQRFQGLHFEVQIRSVLQHAWAEIEHDLGYKSRSEVPRHTRRRFSRIAGLLEIADYEFNAIRGKLREYESQAPSDVESSPAQVGIDKISLRVILEDPLVREIDAELANKIHVTLQEDDASVISMLSLGLHFVNISTVKRLIDMLKQYRELIVYQAVARLKGKGFRNWKRGVSIVQLLWVLMGLQGGETNILRGMKELGLEANKDFAHEVMLRIQEFQGPTPSPRSQSAAV